MRAALLCELRQPLRLAEMPAPVPGPDGILLRVEACGLCHSDVHLADGDWPDLARRAALPRILGHEIVGRVEAVGSEVRDLAPGDRVGAGWLHWTCGRCEPCTESRENLCTAQAITGVTVDGGYAELAAARASHVVRVPEALSSQEAAPLFCAGVTVYRALKNAGIASGDRVAVFGIGGLGHLAVQIARVFGARVVAVDVDPGKLELAEACGADPVLDGTRPDLRARFRGLGGVHHALVTAPSRSAYEAAFGALRRGGSLLMVGAPPEEIRIAPLAMLAGEYRIAGSLVGTRADLRELLALAAEGGVRCRTAAFPLGEVNEAFGAMRRGGVPGRAVLLP